MYLVICNVCLGYLMNLIIMYQIIHNSFLVSIINNNILILIHC
jgi:hypothetical protein